MYTKLLFGLLTLSTFSFAAVYEGSGKYEGREIRITADLNIPNYLTSEAAVVKATEEFEDHYHSDMVTYYCTTSIDFLGPTLMLQVSDAKTGELLMFIDEEEASLRAVNYERSHEKFDCKEFDFSKSEVSVRFTLPNVDFHPIIAKKDGEKVTLGLYPLLAMQAQMKLEKQGERYLIFKADEFESKLEKELLIPISQWGAYTKNVGSISLSLR